LKDPGDIVARLRLEAILFSIGDGILAADEDGVVRLANRRARDILSLAGAGAPEGRPLAEAVPADSPLRPALLEAAEKAGGCAAFEADLSDGERRLVLQVSARPLVAPETGSSLGVVVVFHDVTLRKELVEMKSDFLHAVTHDLRNPLGSILGFLDFLRKGVAGVLNPRQSAMVESMHKSASRLMSMVNNILDLDRMEAGRIKPSLKEASLAGVAGQAVEMLGALAQRRGIRMELKAEEEFTTALDTDQIGRVVLNLLGNAVKFSPDDGCVTVSIEEREAFHLVCVADEGPGIPPAYLEKIFGKFVQVPGHKRGGTGLGLAISKGFVEAHGGRIWAESEPGKGSRFYFTVPKGLLKG
jgi:signal transduction histidine kinase